MNNSFRQDIQMECSSFKYTNFRYARIRKYVGQVVRLRYYSLDTFEEVVLVIDISKDGNLHWRADKSDPFIRYIQTTQIIRITPLPEVEQLIWKLENER